MAQGPHLETTSLKKFCSSLPTLVVAVGIALIGTMAPWLYSAAALALNFATRPVSADKATEWNPPAEWEVNNLTQALNSKGVYGFIFDSSHTPDDKYGQYNYCNMPHVRQKEYVKPSSEYELQYVELIHRHHKRTPYHKNGFPVEAYPWNCDDQGLYFYGQPFDGHDAAKGYRKGYISEINPFKASSWTGSCQFPQITPGGLEDSWQHGADLIGVYRDLLGFLPAKDEPRSSKVKYRVTNNVITSQVAGMVVNGGWDTTEDYPFHIQATDVDSLEPQYSCPAGSSLFNNIKSSNNPDWQAHLDQTQDLFSTLDDISGVEPDADEFHASFDPYFDNLSSRQCHDKPLPCKIVNGEESDTCVTQDMADTVYRLGHWEYSQMYRDHPDSLPSSAARYGVWPAELAAHLREVMNGNRDTLYLHNVAHDGSVSLLLSILQLEKMVWPGMGAEVVFELYKKSDYEEPEPSKASAEMARRQECGDNACLKQLSKYRAVASSICPTYMVATTEAVPTWPPECASEEIREACSCLDSPAAWPTDAPAKPEKSSESESKGESWSGYYVRVLFGGQVLKSSSPTLGRMNMIPVETLLEYFDSLVGREASLVKENCAA